MAFDTLRKPKAQNQQEYVLHLALHSCAHLTANFFSHQGCPATNKNNVALMVFTVAILVHFIPII